MRTPEHGWRQAATTRSHRLIAPIIGLTLLTVGTLIYLLPSGDSGATVAAESARATATRTVAAAPGPTTGSSGVTTSAAAPSASSAHPTASATPTTRVVDVVNHTTVVQPGGATSTVTAPGSTVTAPGSTSTAPGRTRTRTVAAPDKSQHCYDFTWQQDAQTAYLANLSDPYGLDGAPGPANGDGLACTDLPVDPSRPASEPADPYVPPAATAAVKAALVRPTTDYFGITQDDLPNSTPKLTAIDNQLGKAPSSLGFFAYWDHDYPSNKITASWDHGALPVMTWMSERQDKMQDSSYSMSHIIAGDWDDYLYKYAGDIVRTGLPVVIRFDHEMNGNWYGWSAGQTAWNNSPAKYIAMWQHVWQIFQKVGANDDVIWLWSPNRVDNIAGQAGTSSIAADYPGDQYVDWVGASIYWRTGTSPTDYRTSFGKTIADLRAVTSKPMFFAEIGATQTYNSVDVTAGKQAWMQSTLQGFLADPSIVGFSWFDNYVSTPANPSINDWRYDSSSATLATFKNQIDVDGFAAGTMPDATGH